MMDKPIPQPLDAVNSELNRFLVQLLQQSRQSGVQEETVAVVQESAKPLAVATTGSEEKGQLDFVQVKNTAAPKKQASVSQFFTALPADVLAEFDRKQSPIANALKKQLDAIFVSVLNPPDNMGKKKQKLDDNLTLIDDEALMIRLTLDNFATKVNNEFKVGIAIACLRFEKVLGFEIDLMLSPLAPYSIGNALESSLACIDMDVIKKKQLLMAILKATIVEYAQLLKVANDVFIKKGILPKLTESDGKARIDKYLRKMKALEEGLDEEDEKGSGGDDGDGEGDGPSAFARDFFQNIAMPEGSQHVVATNPNGVLIPQAQLLSNIGAMQSVLVTTDQQSGYMQPVQTESTFSELLAANTDIPDYALTAEHSKTIGIISMLFDTLQNEKGISGPIKALLLQLTVPLLKAAVQDDEFFSDKSNPAQVLFNSIAEASSSWTAENSVNNDFLYKKMSSIVQKVTDDYEHDADVFESAVGDFETFVDSEKQKSQKIEERIIAAETAQARIQASRKLAQQRIYEVFGDFILDEELKRFIDKSWEQALFYIANTYFDERDAAEWKQVQSIETTLEKILGCIRVPVTLDQLFADIVNLFVQTGRSEPDVKKELAGIRPELEELIEDAEDEVKVASEVDKNPKNGKQVTDKFAENKEVDFIRDDSGTQEIEDFLDDEIDTVDTLAEAAQVIGEGVAVDDIDDYEKNYQAAQEAAIHSLLEKVGIGSWLEDKETDPSIKVKLAAHIKYTDTYVFVNRKGVKAVSYDGPTFASRLQENLMVVVDNSQLYDRSMETIIDKLRH
jgi:hypothetical protein